MSVSPERMIRDQIKADLGTEFLKPKPWRTLWLVPLFASIFASWYAITVVDIAWYWCLLLSLVIGNSFGAIGFLTHEIAHGAMGISKKLQSIIVNIGFAPFLVTADFWHRWHNIAHHGNTNMGDKDPDSFGTEKRYKRSPAQKVLLKIAPGSYTWYSYLFLFYSFTLHSQAVLWLQTKHRKEFEGFDRKGALIGMATQLSFWIALGILMGWKGALFGIIIPHLIGNAVIQGYILTNHFLRPQAETNNPIDNSMSLNTLPWVDRMHFHFSHHVEHHMFPKMPSANAPLLRKWFLENMPERYVSPSHGKAIQYLYSTPRVYVNAHTLIDVNQPDRTVDLHPLNKEINEDYLPPSMLATR